MFSERRAVLTLMKRHLQFGLCINQACCALSASAHPGKWSVFYLKITIEVLSIQRQDLSMCLCTTDLDF